MENLSQHAVTRMQQRGIPRVALECLLEYGRLQYDHHGAAIVFLDKAARRRLARDLSQSRREAVFPAKAKAVFPAQAGIRRALGFRITVRNDDRLPGVRRIQKAPGFRIIVRNEGSPN